MGFVVEELSDGLDGRFHDSVEHVDDAFGGEVIGRNQTDAVGRVDAVGSVVQVDADLG